MGGGGGDSTDYKSYWNNYVGWLDNLSTNHATSMSKNRAQLAASGVRPGSALWKTSVTAMEESYADERKEIEEGYTAGELSTHFDTAYNSYVYSVENADEDSTDKALSREEYAASRDKDGAIRLKLEERLGRTAELWELEAALEFGLPTIGNRRQSDIDKEAEKKASEEAAAAAAGRRSDKKSAAGGSKLASPNLNVVKSNPEQSPFT